MHNLSWTWHCHTCQWYQIVLQTFQAPPWHHWLILLIVIDTILFLQLQCHLTFDSNFSPTNWEPIWQFLEEFTKTLFKDYSLHRRNKSTNLSNWDGMLALSAKQQQLFTLATTDSYHWRVHLTHRTINLHCTTSLWTATSMGTYLTNTRSCGGMHASNLHTPWQLLALTKWKDQVSFNKLEKFLISFSSCILQKIIKIAGRHGDATRVPCSHFDKIVLVLGTISESVFPPVLQTDHKKINTPWLRFLHTNLYTAIAACLQIYHC